MRAPRPVVERWAGLVGRLGAPAPAAERALADLTARYAEGRRRYHTLEHVCDVIDHVERLAAAGEPVADPLAVELAAWWHDAVQGRGDDEARSAALAAEALPALGVGGRRVGRVTDLIRATCGHVAADADEALLCDADLAVLGRPWPGYLRYARAIRAEHADVDEPRYRRGRAAVLRGLLDRDRVYRTATLRAEREARARENMAAETRLLTDDARPVVAALRVADE